jgi:hypothetical protein
MTLFELEDKLYQLRRLNRLEGSMKVVLHYPEEGTDSHGDKWTHHSSASSVEIKGRDLIISCC